MSVAPPSSAFLYMRKYRLMVRTWAGTTIEIVDLRFTFHIEKSLNRMLQYGAITIYNLSPNTETDIFKNGQSVVLEAGYENGPYGVIFSAPIRQPIRGKESGTDYFLRLVCYAGDEILNIGFCNLTMTAGQIPREIINQIARSSSVPFDVSIAQGVELSESRLNTIGSQKTQRGKTIFGQPGDYMRSIALNNNAVFTFDDGVARFDAIITTPPASMPDLNAQAGLIGFPTQVDKGIQVRCLINPPIRLGSWFHINNQIIIQEELPVEGLQTLLDLDGVYRVIEIVMSGDTRGNDWYFDITAYGQHGPLPLMLSDGSQSGNA